MKRFIYTTSRTSIAVLLFLLGAVATALAGPPLICHPFDIGNARSLLWNGTAWDLSGNENYDTRNLVRDTLGILDSGAPVIVRMETLRRATLYMRKDPQAAKELFTRLHARAVNPGASAFAYFDAGYLAETYKQWLGTDKAGSNPAAGIDGYGLVGKALTMRVDDAQMEFAAALMTLHGVEKEHLLHTQKAMAGAKSDALLARNLSGHFLGNDRQTVADALTHSAAGGGEHK